MSSVISPEEIPTVFDLYTDKVLDDDPESEPFYPYSEPLNKRDITKLKVDMIVNAANRSLLGGGGVDGAIHRAAGPDLLEECKTLGGAATGQTKVTHGYNLPARLVAHTVGPIYSSDEAGRSEDLLSSCYFSSLDMCSGHGGGSIGFSSISTGVYGYPIRDATHVALDTVRQFLETDRRITRVIFVVFSERDRNVYQGIMPLYFPGPSFKGVTIGQVSGPAAETINASQNGVPSHSQSAGGVASSSQTVRDDGTEVEEGS
ncbi:hypothetical protein EHS25_004584 [Saitozyma podzolica]|uniref:Macro domain-containing protein n=1 Tax=Saitozyma podzolica TaxID=1890683 RepID=A0A427YUG3_9TREE|nr:hypothetical protein EHS25_004584 [Saitozyma podzolica]